MRLMLCFFLTDAILSAAAFVYPLPWRPNVNLGKTFFRCSLGFLMMPMEIFGNGIFLASASQGFFPTSYFVATSTGGVRWNSKLLGSNFCPIILGMAFRNGRFVAVGSSRLTSSDGLTWELVAFDDNATPMRVAYGNGIFTAVGAYPD